jgi:hypothetical protein
VPYRSRSGATETPGDWVEHIDASDRVVEQLARGERAFDFQRAACGWRRGRKRRAGFMDCDQLPASNCVAAVIDIEVRGGAGWQHVAAIPCEVLDGDVLVSFCELLRRPGFYPDRQSNADKVWRVTRSIMRARKGGLTLIIQFHNYAVISYT